jgi:hypothetical protein
MADERLISLDAARGVGAFSVALWHGSHFFYNGTEIGYAPAAARPLILFSIGSIVSDGWAWTFSSSYLALYSTICTLVRWLGAISARENSLDADLPD